MDNLEKKIAVGLALSVAIAILLPLYLIGEPGRQTAAAQRQQHESTVRGAEVFVSTQCATCHGARGEGKIGPALNGTKLDEAALIKSISRGRPGTAMMAWSADLDGPLKRHQITDLANFIKNWDNALVEAAERAHGAPAAVSAGAGGY